ncbi:MAG: hypothetical protein JXR40_08815 [Pontiellaceae bacterium]|nr:hypothetical protein [Pontiellaceae bacterium]
MKHHDKDLHVIVQGIEGQVMLDVIDEVGRWPLPFHDAILVPEDFGEFAINALKSAYRKHTKGGQVVVTKQTQK